MGRYKFNYHLLKSMALRQARIKRDTNETQISLHLNLDGNGSCKLDTPVPFLNHMLEQIVKHGQINLEIVAKGDTHIDDHHTVEDIGICFGMALAKALADKKGITRYASAYVPLDEALSRVVIDLSGRSGLFFHANITGSVGNFNAQLVQEFFQGLSNHANITVHIDSIRGHNTHHIIESMFKAFGRSLRQAVTIDSKLNNALPSTKGAL